MRTSKDVLDRVRAEYLAMPGMHLTANQVQRLCGIDRHQCTVALEALVAERFLCVKTNGAYARAWDGHQPRPAQATLRSSTVRRAS